MIKKILIITILFLAVLFCFTSEWWCPSIWGSHSLGNNLYAIDWDNNTQIIVYCDKESLKGRTCYSGASVIPSNDSTYQVRVKSTVSNKEWIIVKAEQILDSKECYFLIHKNFNIQGLNWKKNNCDSILQRYIIGPLPIKDFEEQKKRLNIDIL